MALLPTGLSLPPLPYLIALVVLAAAAAIFLVLLEPRVDQRLVFGFVPWMVAGATAHVLYQIDAYQPTIDLFPAVVEPLAAAPAVYVSTFIALGFTWTGLSFVQDVRASGLRVAAWLASIGIAVVLALFIVAGARGALDNAQPYWPLIGIVVSLVFTVAVYLVMGLYATETVAKAKLLGGLGIFAHVLDGVTTTIGIDILGTSERSPIPEAIMNFAGQLPTAPFLGTGWLFVLVKLAVAIGIVVGFADYLEEDPVRGNLLFTAIVAFGLGPAVNNIILFALRANTAIVG